LTVNFSFLAVFPSPSLGLSGTLFRNIVNHAVLPNKSFIYNRLQEVRQHCYLFHQLRPYDTSVVPVDIGVESDDGDAINVRCRWEELSAVESFGVFAGRVVCSMAILTDFENNTSGGKIVFNDDIWPFRVPTLRKWRVGSDRYDRESVVEQIDQSAYNNHLPRLIVYPSSFRFRVAIRTQPLSFLVFYFSRPRIDKLRTFPLYTEHTPGGFFP
jgi:hypothetical protein